LYEAVLVDDLDLVLQLLSNGADPCWNHGSEQQNGKTSIHVASEKGNLNILCQLLDGKAARSTLRDSNGETPLHKAAAEGRMDICKYLVLEMHTDPNVRNATLQTPGDLAIESDQVQVAEFLSHWSAQSRESYSR
jgi:ankyrin repeat protein